MKKCANLKNHEEQVHPGEKVYWAYNGEQETGREFPIYLFTCSLCDSTAALDPAIPEEVDFMEGAFAEGRIDQLPEVEKNKLLSGFDTKSELLDNPVRKQMDPGEDEHKSFVTDERGKNPFLEEFWEETKKIEPKQAYMSEQELKDRLPKEVVVDIIQMMGKGDHASAAAQLQEWQIDQDTISAVLSGQIKLEGGEDLTMNNFSPVDLGIMVGEMEQKMSEMFHKYTEYEIGDIAAGRISASPEEVEVAKEIVTRGLVASKKAQVSEVETINPGMEGITTDNKKVLVMDPLPDGGFKVHIDGEGTIELSEGDLRSRVNQWFPGIYYSRKRSYKEGEKVKVICANLHSDASIVKEREDRSWIVKMTNTSSLAVVYWDQIYLPLDSVRSKYGFYGEEPLQDIIYTYTGLSLPGDQLEDLKDLLDARQGEDKLKVVYEFLKEKGYPLPSDYNVIAFKKVSYIKQVKDEYCVFTHQTNKNMGCYPTKPEAEKRLEQVKRFGEKKGSIDSFFDIQGNEVKIGEKVFTPIGKEAEVTNINPLMGVSVQVEEGESESFNPKELLKK